MASGFIEWLNGGPGMVLAVLGGLICGACVLIAVEADALSYLGDDPKTCVNCHIMTPHYVTWEYSSHRDRANCIDCHLPHDNIVNKYLHKAKDGGRDVFLFLFHDEPEAIRLRPGSPPVIEENCRRCHRRAVSAMAAPGRRCWECHRQLPHTQISSLSSVPDGQIHFRSSAVAPWLIQALHKKRNP